MKRRRFWSVLAGALLAPTAALSREVCVNLPVQAKSAWMVYRHDDKGRVESMHIIFNAAAERPALPGTGWGNLQGLPNYWQPHRRLRPCHRLHPDCNTT